MLLELEKLDVELLTWRTMPIAQGALRREVRAPDRLNRLITLRIIYCKLREYLYFHEDAAFLVNLRTTSAAGHHAAFVLCILRR